jgi:hypothetical protein
LAPVSADKCHERPFLYLGPFLYLDGYPPICPRNPTEFCGFFTLERVRSLRGDKVWEKAMTNAASSSGDPKIVIGLFRDRESVERAYRFVTQRGYDIGDINVVMSDETRNRYFSDDSQISTELGSKAAEGGELGGPAGGDIGIIIPVLSAGAVLALPGLGFILAGPIAAALAGAGVAGLAVGLIGALSDWGIPEERVQQYEAAIRDGGILMGVRPRSNQDAQYFEQQWKASGGQQVHS